MALVNMIMGFQSQCEGHDNVVPLAVSFKFMANLLLSPD